MNQRQRVGSLTLPMLGEFQEQFGLVIFFGEEIALLAASFFDRIQTAIKFFDVRCERGATREAPVMKLKGIQVDGSPRSTIDTLHS